MAIEIRRITPDDAQAYRVLRVEGLKEFPWAFGSSYENEAAHDVEYFRNAIAARDPKKSFIYGAFVDGVLSGMVGFYQETQLKLRHRGMIWGMYVRSTLQGTGVGKKLIAAAIEDAKANVEHLEQIHLAVVMSNEPAVRLYQSAGFEVYAVEKHSLKVDGVYYDEYLMQLFLNK